MTSILFYVQAIDVVGAETTICLAGDPCQLGPSLRSEIAAKKGLCVSFQERLMNLDFYKKSSVRNGHENRNMTTLLNNYRSHEAILKLPSNLFYENKLKACANPDDTTSLCQWDMLPKNNNTNEAETKDSISSFPFLFYGVFGQGNAIVLSSIMNLNVPILKLTFLFDNLNLSL